MKPLKGVVAILRLTSLGVTGPVTVTDVIVTAACLRLSISDNRLFMA